jgi:hypothetical protein
VVDFFNEVDEDVRAGDARNILRKSLPWIIGVAVLIVVAVGAYWGWTAWQNNGAAKASEAYDRGVKALANGDMTGADAAFTDASKTGPRVYRSAAMTARAGILIQQNKTDAAVKMLDDAAAASPDPIQGDLDSLKATYLILDKAPFADVEKRLKPLMEKGRPYRTYAQEAMAMAELISGRTKEARIDFKLLSVKGPQDAGDDVRRRAEAAVSLIDSGQAAQVITIAKAAAALPPPPAAGPNPFAQAGNGGGQAGAPQQ